jgi:hypothetical protein
MRNGTGKEGVYVFSTRDTKTCDEVIAAYSLQQYVQCLCSACVPIVQEVDSVVNVNEAESHDEDEDMGISKSNVASLKRPYQIVFKWPARSHISRLANAVVHGSAGCMPDS